jgi:hypothetical protein
MTPPWRASDGVGGADGAPAPSVELDASSTADEESRFFRSDEENKFHDQHRKALDLRNEQFEQDMRHRKEYAGKAFWLAIAWIAFIAALTAAQFAAGWCGRGEGLDTTSYAAIVGSTTLNVLGFWVFVGRYLFTRRGEI